MRVSIPVRTRGQQWRRSQKWPATRDGGILAQRRKAGLWGEWTEQLYFNCFIPPNRTTIWKIHAWYKSWPALQTTARVLERSFCWFSRPRPRGWLRRRQPGGKPWFAVSAVQVCPDVCPQGVLEGSKGTSSPDQKALPRSPPSGPVCWPPRKSSRAVSICGPISRAAVKGT